MPERRLLRSRTQRRIAGVCGGLAKYFDTDPVFIRLGFVGAVFIPPFAAAAIVGYLAAWIIVPVEEDEAPAAPTVAGGSVGDSFTGSGASPDASGMMPPPAGAAGSGPGAPGVSFPADASLLGGVIFISLGLFFLAMNLGLLPWDLLHFWRWRVLWPVVVIVIGVAMLVRAAGWGGARSDGR